MGTNCCFSLQVKYERDLLLMLILDEEEFGPGAFDRAVQKLKQGAVAGAWWSDAEKTKANAIFLSDGRKISIVREGGASWMVIGKAAVVLPMEASNVKNSD